MYVILKLITVGVGGQAGKVEMHCITLLCCISIFPLYVYLKTKQKKKNMVEKQQIKTPPYLGSHASPS